MTYPEYKTARIGKTTKGVVVYDYHKCIEVLMETYAWTQDESQDWFWHNSECAYFGDETPIFIIQDDEHT